MRIYREITSLKVEDVFVIMDHENARFNYPIHDHPEYELNLVINGRGNRIIGDSVAKYQHKDLVLIGPHVYHRWDDDDMEDKEQNTARVITIQFGNDLFSNHLFSKNVFYPIHLLLEKSYRGIAFSGDVLEEAARRMICITKMEGFTAVIEFLSLLDFLANSKTLQLLASEGFSAKPFYSRNKRIKDVYNYILENYAKSVKLSEAANIANMSESAFSHFFKKCTRKSFTQFVIELRISQACKQLLETQNTINEICYQCGFNNVSNFNRLFKKYKNQTPHNFRKQFDLEYTNFEHNFILN